MLCDCGCGETRYGTKLYEAQDRNGMYWHIPGERASCVRLKAARAGLDIARVEWPIIHAADLDWESLLNSEF